MLTLKKKCSGKSIILLVAIILLANVLNILIPGTAAAEPSKSLEIFGDGVKQPTLFTLEQLQEMEQVQKVYSAINTWPTKKWYVGEGVNLRSLLDSVGMSEEARMIRFYSNDGYSLTLTIKELFEDQRYCFPHFMDNSSSDGGGNILGSSEGAEPVEAIIALKSVEGSNNPKYMNDLNSLLLMLGQRAVSEQTGNLFVKYLDRIEVLREEPPQWDSPQANPEPGAVEPGTMVTLSNANMDDDKIYYTTDGSVPTVNSNMYNWIARRWWSARSDVLGLYNKPIGPINEDITIKAITIGNAVTYGSGNIVFRPVIFGISEAWFLFTVQGESLDQYSDKFSPTDGLIRFKAAIWVSPNNLISQQVLNIVLGPVTANITQLSSQLPGHNGKFAEVVYLYRDGRAFYGSAQVYPLINRVILIEDTGSLAFLELGRIKFQGQAYHPFKLVAAFSIHLQFKDRAQQLKSSGYSWR
jgi:hypothetical protein